MSRSTFKILFYVKKGSERANGYLPLMCRLTVDGEIKQFSCKLDVPPKLWDVKTARATGKSAEAQKINAAVDRIRVDVNRRYQELMQSDGYVTAARLRDACLGLGVKRETLLKLFEQHNGEFIKKVGHSRVQGTYNRYRTIYRHLCEFVPKVYRRDDIPLKELNLTFINNFEYFLRTEKKLRHLRVPQGNHHGLLPHRAGDGRQCHRGDRRRAQFGQHLLLLLERRPGRYPGRRRRQPDRKCEIRRRMAPALDA